MVKYSIIVPCYNAEKYIENLYHIFSKSNREDYEVIFVDDCSKDNTYDKLLNSINKKKNFIVLQTEKNGGPGIARNKALEHVQGKFVMFCDSDDYFDIKVLDYIDKFVDNSNVDMLVFPYYIERNKKKIKCDEYSKYSEGEKICVTEVASKSGMLLMKVFNNSIIRDNQIRFLDRMTGEDKCFCIDYLIHANDIFKCNYVFYNYVQNKKSIMHTHKVHENKMETTFEILEKKYETYFPEIIKIVYVNDYLLSNIKHFTKTKKSGNYIKKWLREKNKKYPNWIYEVDFDNQNLYRKLIYKAMYNENPYMIKLVMWIRRIMF